MTGTRSVQVPFRFALPADLPTSCIYAGERMSLFRVEYFLHCKFIGLSSNGINPPAGTLIKEERLFVPVRAVDSLPELSKIQEHQGVLKKMFGGNNGIGRFSVSLTTNSIMNGEAARLRVVINNSESKLAVECVKLQLHREIKLKG